MSEPPQREGPTSSARLVHRWNVVFRYFNFAYASRSKPTITRVPEIKIGRRNTLTSAATAFANTSALGGVATQPFSFTSAWRVLSSGATPPAFVTSSLTTAWVRPVLAKLISSTSSCFMRKELLASRQLVQVLFQ